jgi:hypothetical protein
LAIGSRRRLGVAARPQDRAGNFLLKARLFLVAAAVFAAAPARAQDPPAAADNAAVTTRTAPPKTRPAQDIAIEGGGSFGHYRIFAGGWDAKQYIGGVEYDRNSWGRFLGARSDYVAELLPIMRLNETAHTDLWGDPIGPPGRKILYGVGFSPIGFRLVWGQHWLRPFVGAKAGVDVWNHKFISDQGTYIQFTLHEALGGLVKLTDEVDLRMEVGDFHQSNGFMTDVNPGLDVASYDAALVYHLGSRRGRVR